MIQDAIKQRESVETFFLLNGRKKVYNESFNLGPLNASEADIILYPIINNQRSNDVGQKFVNGLVELGFGKLETRNGKSGFVPYHPDKQDCPNPEQLKSYWEKLNIKSTQ